MAEIRSRLGYCDLEKVINEKSYEKQLRKVLKKKIVPLKKHGEPYLRKIVLDDKGDFFVLIHGDELKEWSLRKSK